MQQKPQRPYVPHGTPKSSARIPGDSEFRLSRPFVPGGEREQIAAQQAVGAADLVSIHSESEPVLRGINEFLETSSPSDRPRAIEARDSYQFEAEEEPFELPPIEHFTDPLPGVETFAPDGVAGAVDDNADGMDYSSAGTAPPIPGGTGWVEEDWQRFDWRAAAALGDAPDAAASNDWATTDWDAASPIPRELRPSAAHAIASALDQIARRIRDGELALPAPGDLGNQAAIAAKLAALLGVRS